jgi:FkbM family methyltransferase
LQIECSTREMIGGSIVRTGVFEMATTEALVRLVDPGELVFDVGANIGYMTSVLAGATGSAGRVVAYEPNPDVCQLLSRNVSRWQAKRLATIEVRQAALSDRKGTAPLTIPHGGSEWAALGNSLGGRAGQGPSSTISVPTVTLDDELGGEHIGVLKLDVEDHEPETIRGAQLALGQKRIRDVLFEDHNRYPSETTAALEEHGYSIFDLGSRTLGIALHPPGAHVESASWHAPMRLATVDPRRALLRVSTRGWLSLRNPARWAAALPRHS